MEHQEEVVEGSGTTSAITAETSSTTEDPFILLHSDQTSSLPLFCFWVVDVLGAEGTWEQICIFAFALGDLSVINRCSLANALLTGVPPGLRFGGADQIANSVLTPA